MSIDALKWAWSAPVDSATERLVLLALADRAGEDHTAWPSANRLVNDTKLDIKTVKKVITDLMKKGLLEDTGERKGATGRVRVIKLVGVDGRENSPKNGLIHQQDDRSNNGPKTGTIKQTQKRNDSKNGINPNFPPNEPNFGSLNEPNFGSQNLSENLPRNPPEEKNKKNMGEGSSKADPTDLGWIPNLEFLNTRLRMAGAHSIDQKTLNQILVTFNPHFDDGPVMSDNKRLAKLVNWILDKQQRTQVEQAKPSASQKQISRPKPHAQDVVTEPGDHEIFSGRITYGQIRANLRVDETYLQCFQRLVMAQTKAG